jgi:hypothetical protein
MSNPIRICKLCDEPFELKPDKPGLVTQCPACSAPKSNGLPGARTANRHDLLKRYDFFIRFSTQDKERAERLGDGPLATMRENEIRMLSQAKLALGAKAGSRWDF